MLAHQSKLSYASFVASHFTVFLVMLGGQLVNRYLRNREGSATNKSRGSQRKLVLSILTGVHRGNDSGLSWALSVSIHLYPHPCEDNIQLGFSWVTEALNSGYPVSKAVRLSGKRPHSWDFHIGVRSVWIFPLLTFLSLSEVFYSTDPPPHPGHTAPRIPLASRGHSDFYTRHPPSPHIVSKAEDIPDEDRDNVLEAIGDLF